MKSIKEEHLPINFHEPEKCHWVDHEDKAFNGLWVPVEHMHTIRNNGKEYMVVSTATPGWKYTAGQIYAWMLRVGLITLD